MLAFFRGRFFFPYTLVKLPLKALSDSTFPMVKIGDFFAAIRKHMGVSKNGGFSPKMDGL